jgi:hypothetical protein
MISFIVIVGAMGGANAELRRVVLIDLVALAGLLAAAGIERFSAAGGPPPSGGAPRGSSQSSRQCPKRAARGSGLGGGRFHSTAEPPDG